MRLKLLIFASLLVGIVLVPVGARAHEAYVLDHAFFWQQMMLPYSTHAVDALKSPANVALTLKIVGSVLLLLVLNFFFRRSRVGQHLNRTLERLAKFGPLFIRVAIAAAFYESAASWSFLGPELSIHQMSLAWLIRATLYAASIMIALGLFTEVAGGAALIAFTLGYFTFGAYLSTYLNYLGEIVVLLLFGMRTWSVDRWLFGSRVWLQRWKKYDTTIVRICYGAALIFAAITVKFLHPALTVQVITQWHLTQFHWLFPSDPLLVALGAGLAECAIGFFILVGFETRLTVIISLFYITLSLLYFRELVWPHLMLYGISLNLMVQPETFTLDRLFLGRRRS